MKNYLFLRGRVVLMAKTYIVNLNQVEKEQLFAITTKGQSSARKVKRANILLLADMGKTDKEIAATLHTSIPTIERTRQKFVAGDLDFALDEKLRSGRTQKLNIKIEAVLASIAQSTPPDGRKHWTIQLLTDRLAALTELESISRESVRQALKKTS